MAEKRPGCPGFVRTAVRRRGRSGLGVRGWCRHGLGVRGWCRSGLGVRGWCRRGLGGRDGHVRQFLGHR